MAPPIPLSGAAKPRPGAQARCGYRLPDRERALNVYRSSRMLSCHGKCREISRGCWVSLLIIRSSKRFAVRQSISLVLPCGTEQDGLLVEVSLSGCRISAAGSNSGSSIAAGLPGVDDSVTVRIDGFDDMPARVRWSGEGVLGLRLNRPLHKATLERIIGHCRESRYKGTNLLFGT
jgi:hypothetical protein